MLMYVGDLHLGNQMFSWYNIGLYSESIMVYYTNSC